MELVIFDHRNNTIFARTFVNSESDHTDFELLVFDNPPEYPLTEPEIGYFWDLEVIDGNLAWVQKARPLTLEERIANIERQQYAWRENMKYWNGQDIDTATNTKPAQSRVWSDGTWYLCIQSHTSVPGWEPSIYTASLWTVDPDQN